MKLLNKIKNWFNSPPNKNDLFGVNIRETYQLIKKLWLK